MPLTSHWRRLDNTAKIFPATSGKRDTRVFRLYCELNEEVRPQILQQALDRTVEKYPLFLSVLRKGFFWYYLEKSHLEPQVQQEYGTLCKQLYFQDRKNLLFEVTYFEKRINFEVFHALTDGTGAVEFLRELVKDYLFLAHPRQLPDQELRDEMITHEDHETDSFDRYYQNRHQLKKSPKVKMYQIHGARTEYGEMNLTEEIFPAQEVLGLARKYKVSVTILLTGALILAISQERRSRNRRRPIGIMVPVNLRKYFPSESMLNFFGWIDPYYRFETGEEDLEQVVTALKEVFADQLTKEHVAARMNDLIRLERNPVLRAIPLEIKILSLKMANSMATGDTTAIFSNLGVISMPEEYQPYVSYFGFFTSTPKVELCSCSYGSKMSLSFTSAYESGNIERNFFRILREQGLEPIGERSSYPERTGPAYEGIAFFRTFSFVAIAVVIVTMMVNIIAGGGFGWLHYSALGAFCMWAFTAVAFFKRRNLLKNAVWQQILVPGFCVLWDWYTNWKGWSVDYVFPIVCLVILVSMVVITRIQKLKPAEYLIYYLIAGLIGLVPGLFLLLNLTKQRIPSVLCAGCSLLFLLGIFFFRWKAVRMEMEKKFHL